MLILDIETEKTTQQEHIMKYDQAIKVLQRELNRIQHGKNSHMPKPTQAAGAIRDAIANLEEINK